MGTPENTVDKTPAAEPVHAPGRCELSLEGRADTEFISGSNSFISWGARSDVGLVREHNEDSFLLRTPLFAVCDGMGGHAAGEVASSIAVKVIGEEAPNTADDVLLGAAIEAANQAVIEAPQKGIGKAGMGSTASAIFIEGNQMAVAHVGDSRIYLLHHGTLVRVTHDHSYVEELVDSGQITADEARNHPSRSVVTRALGSDPEMYADHFTLEVSDGDRIILCSDGLSSMILDDEIESIAVSNITPQNAADSLVSAALTAGGADNITVIVVDILDDGLVEKNRRRFTRGILATSISIIALLVVSLVIAVLFIRSEYYIGINGSTVAIYQGVPSKIAGVPLSNLIDTTTIEVKNLPQSVQDKLALGIRVKDETEARETVEDYREQINDADIKAAKRADDAKSEGEPTGETETTSPDASSQNSGGE
ncbi:Stp1/IreP family PP2C-type Ser/Thr phosphatase [Lancefieldella rimae]|uniref:Stp1/IreP family PP2C-type Ser/Thr phosphatase n=1 Tax=Lancefieldella rimae TaxID=1383 RepID=UPI001CB4329A|nr:Stp1/IreP family PP2C-type Ser/Thr phosphatase [Lancefieldella rimae]MBF4804861.1 Stp1/IreP family PP2C-type Ser/Thr phosphatase [Lancefieldella rimae]